MDMCYSGALVMPTSYAVMDCDEMTYVEGGRTGVVVKTAKEIRKTLELAVNLGIAGIADGAFLGALAGGLFGAALVGCVAKEYFGQWKALSSAAHGKVESIIRKYGLNKVCKMTTTTTELLYPTSITVQIV